MASRVVALAEEVPAMLRVLVRVDIQLVHGELLRIEAQLGEELLEGDRFAVLKTFCGTELQSCVHVYRCLPSPL